ncbi:MAG: hypothetical protein QM724_09925 [Flavobacteriales bacterium]
MGLDGLLTIPPRCSVGRAQGLHIGLTEGGERIDQRTEKSVLLRIGHALKGVVQLDEEVLQFHRITDIQEHIVQVHHRGPDVRARHHPKVMHHTRE